jgi:hypothetical protein
MKDMIRTAGVRYNHGVEPFVCNTIKNPPHFFLRRKNLSLQTARYLPLMIIGILCALFYISEDLIEIFSTNVI